MRYRYIEIGCRYFEQKVGSANLFFGKVVTVGTLAPVFIWQPYLSLQTTIQKVIIEED